MMTMVLLGTFLQSTLMVTFVGLCVLLCLIILIQKPKGGGLSGAFGGGDSSQVFGGKSGDILTWVTVTVFLAFLFVGMGLVVVTRGEARTGGPTVNTSEATLTTPVEESEDAGRIDPVTEPGTDNGEGDTEGLDETPVEPGGENPGDASEGSEDSGGTKGADEWGMEKAN